MDPEQLAAKLRSLTAPFTSGLLATLALTFVLVIGVVIASAMWLNKPTYRLLQADLDPETMRYLEVEIGLTLAKDFDLREIGMLYYVAASSKTLGDALRRIERDTP